VVYKVVGYDTCQESDSEIDFTGQGSMNVVGLIYAPHSLVRYGGSNYASLTMTGQTIAGCAKYIDVIDASDCKRFDLPAEYLLVKRVILIPGYHGACQHSAGVPLI
jgi:hypothetical protein